jgi:hypothetical protein
MSTKIKNENLAESQVEKSIEEKREQFIKDMLELTGPIMRLADFNKYSALPAAQTMRNKMKELPKDIFYKHGSTTMVDMTAYLPLWANGLKHYGRVEA